MLGISKAYGRGIQLTALLVVVANLQLSHGRGRVLQPNNEAFNVIKAVVQYRDVSLIRVIL